MKYMLLLYGDESMDAQATEAEMESLMAAYGAFESELAAAGAMVSGEGLQPTATATTLRVRNGETLTTHGPFVETTEQLGGFFVIECDNLDDALGWAAKVPAALDGSVEVRPVLDFEE